MAVATQASDTLISATISQIDSTKGVARMTEDSSSSTAISFRRSLFAVFDRFNILFAEPAQTES